MSHVRTQIRQAARTVLAAVAPTTASRILPLEETDLPALQVYTNDETIVPAIHGAYQRTIDLIVVAKARGEGLDDALDDLISGVEKALNHNTLGGLCKPLAPTEITVSINDGSTLIGQAKMTFRTAYFTEYLTPDIAT